MDNVFNHSNSPRGYIMAQIHGKKKDVSISIFDTGIGIFNTIKQSGEYSPKSESDAISLSMEKGVSGNRNIGQGNGMWGLKQIVEDNKGYMAVYSGRTSIKYDFSNATTIIDSNIPILSDVNLSTRIDFTLKFSNIININKALDNYSPYEKINRDIEDKMNNDGYIVFKVKNEAIYGVGTRLSGKSLKNSILNLAKIDVHPILIDFDGVDMISSSFADEFIGKLVSEVGFVQFMSKFKIVKTNNYIDGLINKAIKARQ